MVLIKSRWRFGKQNMNNILALIKLFYNRPSLTSPAPSPISTSSGKPWKLVNPSPSGRIKLFPLNTTAINIDAYIP